MIVQGRLGGASGARRKLAEIRTDIASVEYAKEVDESSCNSDSLATEGLAGIKRLHSELGDSAGLLSPDTLLSHKVSRRFQNRLAIVGASPGCLHFHDGLGDPE